MAQKRRFLDVWIVESNTVYREVPFTVVTDWVQQGRLLGDDKVRPSGTAEWYAIGTSPTFAAYMPKMEENRAEDQAEALDKVEIDFAWKRGHAEDESDVDMIPLIDVSLVLLIFFMMTATVGALAGFNLPEARYKMDELAEDMKLWVGIGLNDRDGKATGTRNDPFYSLGHDKTTLVAPTKQMGMVLKGLRDEIRNSRGRVKIRLRGDATLPIEKIQEMSIQLKNIEYAENQKSPGKVQVIILGEVNEIKR
jgi:biopolymer transport protein ExbD